jgi:hypothetical protein
VGASPTQSKRIDLGQGSVSLPDGGAEWWKSPCSDLRGPGRATAQATRPPEVDYFHVEVIPTLDEARKRLEPNKLDVTISRVGYFHVEVSPRAQIPTPPHPPTPSPTSPTSSAALCGPLRPSAFHAFPRPTHPRIPCPLAAPPRSANFPECQSITPKPPRPAPRSAPGPAPGPAPSPAPSPAPGSSPPSPPPPPSPPSPPSCSSARAVRRATASRARSRPCTRWRSGSA